MKWRNARTKQRRRANSAYRPLPFPCEGCGEIITRVTKGHARKRCDPCATKRQREQIAAWWKANPVKLTVKRRNHSQRRRAAKHQVPVESFSVVEIYERDGWICWLCGYRVNAAVKYPEAHSASLDHVQPLSLGGSHTRDNVRLACLECNVRRGNKLPA